MPTFPKVLFSFLFCTLFFSFYPVYGGKIPDTVANMAQLDQVLSRHEDTIKIVFRAGDFHLTSHPDVDTSIRELDTVPTPVHITYGLRFTASYVMLKGAP